MTQWWWESRRLDPGADFVAYDILRIITYKLSDVETCFAEYRVDGKFFFSECSGEIYKSVNCIVAVFRISRMKAFSRDSHGKRFRFLSHDKAGAGQFTEFFRAK